MTDDELEEWLARYRPVPPPFEPPHRGVSTETTRPRGGWMSLAALGVIILVFHALAARERAAVQARVEHTHDRQLLVRELTYRLGAGEFSLQTARALIELSDAGGDVE